MESAFPCPECSAPTGAGESCQERFEKMLAWEYEDMPRLGAVHHLMVLCFHLQHPSRYSPDGLKYAMQLLTNFVDHGITPADARRQNRERVSSSSRKWKITGTPEAYGAYGHPMQWKMTAADVIAGGIEGYVENVHQWAGTIIDDLRATANLPPSSGKQSALTQ